jgi:hypothetical protein
MSLSTYDQEKEDRKRSQSNSSVGAPEFGGESDVRERERDRKGRKNSVFGNLFKKKTKKSSKDEDAPHEQEVVEAKADSVLLKEDTPTVSTNGEPTKRDRTEFTVNGGHSKDSIRGLELKRGNGIPQSSVSPAYTEVSLPVLQS